MAVASDAVVQQARQALEEVKARREQANLSLVASDPSCFPAQKIWVRVASTGPLCAPDGSQPGVVAVILDPVDERTLEPTVLLISALGDYGDALGKIAGEPKPDVSKELKDVIEKATKAQTIANGLLQLGLPDPAKLLTGEQRDAATNLIQFAAELLQEADKVRRIRKIAAEQSPKIDGVSEKLRLAIRNWIENSAQGDAEILRNNLTSVYKVAVIDKGSKTTWDYDKRLKFLQLIAAARSDEASLRKRLKAFDEALDELKTARQKLADALAGKVSAAERREIEQENERRVLRALGLLAKAVMAFSTGL